MKPMVLLLLSLISGLVSGQTMLKAGTYRHLKPTRPMVLDTGSFTFIGLEMKDLGEGIWVDARKAQNVTLIDCLFLGHEHAIGLLPGKVTRIQGGTFNRFQTAIQVETRTADSLRLEQTIMENNGMGLCLEEEGLVLEMTGNVFLTDETQSRIGVYLGPKASLAQSIGQDGKRMMDTPPPAGNLWPVSRLAPDTVLYLFLPLSVWVNRQAPPTGWQSLVNANPQAELRYFAFDNEFVSGLIPDGRVLVHQNHMPPFTYAFIPKDSVEARKMEAIGNWQEVQLAKDFSFPSKLWFSPNPDQKIRFELGRLDTLSRHIQMGELITDPGTGQARLPIFIPHPLAGKGALALRRQGTRRAIKTLPLQKSGRQEVSFSTESFEKGVFLYEVLLEGRSIGTRQWVFR